MKAVCLPVGAVDGSDVGEIGSDIGEIGPDFAGIGSDVGEIVSDFGDILRVGGSNLQREARNLSDAGNIGRHRRRRYEIFLDLRAGNAL